MRKRIKTNQRVKGAVQSGNNNAAIAAITTLLVVIQMKKKSSMMKSTTVGIFLTFQMSSTGISLLNVGKVFIFVTYFSSATVYLKVVCKLF